jgi:hypothetical protein
MKGADRGWVYGCQKAPLLTQFVQSLIKKELSMKLEDVTPEYISKWTVKTAAGLAARNSALILYQLLVRAAQTDKAKTKNIRKKPDMVCLQP